MKRALTSFAVFLLSGVGFSSAAMAACPGILALPAATAQNSVTFGDGISYSLPILGLDVQSSPGQINDCIVVATGSSGTPITTNFAGMDNAYATPSGTGGSSWFRTGAVANGQADPQAAKGAFVPEFTGDTATTWDTTLSALKAFLGDGVAPVIYFNHNQTKSGGTVDEDLFIWAQIRLVNSTTGETKYFYVSSSAGGSIINLPDNFGIPGGDPTLWTGPQTDATCTYPEGTDFACGFPTGGVTPNPFFDPTGALAGGVFMVKGVGHVCLNALGVPQVCDGTEASVVDHNLGADHVANAVVFPELNAILLSPGFGGFDVLQVDLRMGCNPLAIASGTCSPGSVLNNGFEQLFIGRLNPQICVGPGCAEIPEPTTLALLGLGLLFAAGVGGLRRRKI
jgi:PEP-CTERM motif-containing protein